MKPLVIGNKKFTNRFFLGTGKFATREPPAFRDRIVLTAADNMSAGSRVTPGGYAILAGNRKQDVAQFTLSDSRTPDEVYAAIRANGQEVVFKNWDNRI